MTNIIAKPPMNPRYQSALDLASKLALETFGGNGLSAKAQILLAASLIYEHTIACELNTLESITTRFPVADFTTSPPDRYAELCKPHDPDPTQ